MDALVSAISRAQRCYVTAHIHPDGDAVGSVIALTLGLQQLGKEVVPILADGVPESFHYLLGSLVVQQELPAPPVDPSDTLLIVLDLSDANRTGFKDTVHAYAKLGRLACLDHHQAGDMERLANYLVRQPEASSCCELVYRLFQELGVRLTPPLATALLTGMYTDTGGFQFDNTTTQTLEIGSELMKRGAKLQTIVDRTSHQKSVATLRLTGIALERLRITVGGRIAVSFLTQEDMHKVGASIEDMGGIVSQLNVLEGTAMTLLLTEIEPGVVRGSVRSSDHVGKTTVPVTPFARLLGGGGHIKAAGFTLPLRFVRDDQAPDQWHLQPV